MLHVDALRPVKFRAQERRLVLWIRHVASPSMLREFGPPSTAHACGNSRVLETCEELHGVGASHSSPIKSIGVNGAVRSSAAPTLSSPGETKLASRSPRARFPIWSWFCRQTTNRWPGVRVLSMGRPWLRRRKLDHGPSWKRPPRKSLRWQRDEQNPRNSRASPE